MNEQKRCGRSRTFSIISPDSIRGQVTIFLIIGIVILFVFAGGYYMISKIIKTPLTTKEAQQTAEMGIKERVPFLI